MKIPSFLNIPKYLTNRNIAVVILFVMLTQLVFIEGYTISPLKVGLMALLPFVFIIKVPYISKTLIIGFFYWLSIIFSGLFHPESFRFSTIGYLGMFVITFITFYSLIYSEAVSLTCFIKFIKWMIFAYAVCLLCQQLFVLLGIRFMPLINLNNQFFLSIDKLPSLSIEPSHSARILGVLMYSYMMCNSFKQKRPFRFCQLFKHEHKWVTYAFLWTMLTMGSGTAFVVLGILSLYFISWRNLLIVIPILIGLIFIGSRMGISQFDRAVNVASVSLTLDTQKVINTDGSASARIIPLLNTINNLDLTKKEHWLGYGIDAGHIDSSNRMLSEITDYGFLSYLLGLILIFSCAIRFWSIPTIMYLIGVGGGTANIAYQWGILMVFICVRYFYNSQKVFNNENS